MKWLQAELSGKVKTGEDELKNPVYDEKVICNFSGRFTPWNLSEISNLGNTYTVCRRKLITRSFVDTSVDKWDWITFSFDNGEITQGYEHCTILIENSRYTIENIKRLNSKFVVLTIKAVKL